MIKILINSHDREIRNRGMRLDWRITVKFWSVISVNLRDGGSSIGEFLQPCCNKLQSTQTLLGNTALLKNPKLLHNSDTHTTSLISRLNPGFSFRNLSRMSCLPFTSKRSRDLSSQPPRYSVITMAKETGDLVFVANALCSMYPLRVPEEILDSWMGFRICKEIRGPPGRKCHFCEGLSFRTPHLACKISACPNVLLWGCASRAPLL